MRSDDALVQDRSPEAINNAKALQAEARDELEVSRRTVREQRIGRDHMIGSDRGIKPLKRV
jgi:hypothetical protein